jgi:hypothetical protein
MTIMTSPSEVLVTIARSLVATQRYPTVEDALQSMAASEVRRKISYYHRRIRALERKHGSDFDTFSRRLQGQATPDEEDEWLSWRSAIHMLTDWEKAYEGLRSGRTRA